MFFKNRIGSRCQRPKEAAPVHNRTESTTTAGLKEQEKNQHVALQIDERETVLARHQQSSSVDIPNTERQKIDGETTHQSTDCNESEILITWKEPPDPG